MTYVTLCRKTLLSLFAILGIVITFDRVCYEFMLLKLYRIVSNKLNVYYSNHAHEKLLRLEAWLARCYF